MKKLLLAVLMITLGACGPTKKQLRSELAVCEGENAGLKNDIQNKNERLARFNQMEKDGTLRGLKEWKGDVSKPVTGKEEWMK